MDCSIPGVPVLPYLLEFAQIHVYWVYLTISSSAVHVFSFQSFPASGSFAMSQFFVSGGVSASESVLLMNIWGWFPLELIGLISLLCKGISRVFSSTTVQRHQFFSTQPFLLSSSHIHTSVQCRRSVSLTLCNPMDYSTPGYPVHHQLPEFTHTHVHRVGNAIQPSHSLPSSSPPSFNLSQHQGLFQWVMSLIR